jgi:hypothetical protein
MKMKERIMAVLRHEHPDVIPFTVYTSLMPRGAGERELRNMGLCLLDSSVPTYGMKTPHVKMETTEDIAALSSDDRYAALLRQKHLLHRKYVTPSGTVAEEYKWGYAVLEWPCEWMIKDLRDYGIVESIIEDTEYFPNHEEFLSTQEVMGDDGIVFVQTPKSPLQSMLLDLMGYKRFSLDYHLHRHEFEELYRVFFKKQLELYKIVAESPTEVVDLDDNINGIVTSPRLFEQYCMPFYEEVATILHKRDKILMVHLDGKLKCLRDLIAKTNIDVVEAFTPPPIGDMSLEEAQAAWKGKILWTNFPATIGLEGGLDNVESATLAILKSAAPGDDFALGITEDIGNIKSVRYESILKSIARVVNEQGVYPIAIKN